MVLCGFVVVVNILISDLIIGAIVFLFFSMSNDMIDNINHHAKVSEFISPTKTWNPNSLKVFCPIILLMLLQIFLFWLQILRIN